MAIQLDLDIGTNQDDIFDDIAAFSVNIGLRGNDQFFADDIGGFTVLLGGEDNDTYIVDGAALIYDVLGSDTIQAPNINLDDSYIITLDEGRHAFIYDTETNSTLVLIDVDSGAAFDDWIQFDGYGDKLSTFFDHIDEFDAFIGDLDWATLNQLGLPSIPNGDANDAIFNAKAAQAEAQQLTDVAEIALLYEAALDRIPDIEGFNFWIDVFEGGQSFKQIAEDFLDNPEFAEKFGDIDTLSAEEYVNQLYLNVLGRDADAGGSAFWTDQIEEKGKDFADILLAFATSEENTANATYLEFLEEVEPGYWDWV